jgi:hypothetical protein
VLNFRKAACAAHAIHPDENKQPVAQHLWIAEAISSASHCFEEQAVIG